MSKAKHLKLSNQEMLKNVVEGLYEDFCDLRERQENNEIIDHKTELVKVAQASTMFKGMLLEAHYENTLARQKELTIKSKKLLT